MINTTCCAVSLHREYSFYIEVSFNKNVKTATSHAQGLIARDVQLWLLFLGVNGNFPRNLKKPCSY